LRKLGYTYAEATWTQTLPDWIEAHVRMYLMVLWEEYRESHPEGYGYSMRSSIAIEVSWFAATTRAGTPASNWRTMLLCRSAYNVTSVGSSPALAATRRNGRVWSDLRHGPPSGLTSRRL
jgi:hypothetical protein